MFYLLFRYREAKTKFIFDPESGNVEWEQKLPMSWHAFNETPKFEVSSSVCTFSVDDRYFKTTDHAACSK
jgi:hypothetical protein